MAAKGKKKTKATTSPRTYKLIELVGTSQESYDAAVKNAVADASKSINGLSWLEVVEFRGHISNGRVDEFQAKIKVGFGVKVS